MVVVEPPFLESDGGPMNPEQRVTTTLCVFSYNLRKLSRTGTYQNSSIYKREGQCGSTLRENIYNREGK